MSQFQTAIPLDNRNIGIIEDTDKSKLCDEKWNIASKPWKHPDN